MPNILITGTNRGIGLELVRQYAADGSSNRIFACCRNPGNADALNEIAKSASDGPVSVYQLDVTDDQSAEALARELGDTPIDILINNAGIMGGERQSADDMDYGAWAETLAVNTMAPLRVSMAFLPHLKRSAASPPKIITISSQMGSLNRKIKGMYAYRSSKAAVNKVMQVLSLELADDGISVNPVHPGWVRTDMGGPGADISPQESAEGLRALIAKLTLDDSGKFFLWDGNEHAW